MVYDQSEEYLNLKKFSEIDFKARYGRFLLPGELGCTLSHNRARELAAQNSRGGIILEEDAEIKDLDRFVTTSMEFLETYKSHACILSFYNNEYRFNRNKQASIFGKWIRHFGGPSSTVGYAVTRESAANLLMANTPIRFLADWPIARTSFYIALMDVISHSDDPEISSIGHRGNRRSGFTFKDRIDILTTRFFFKNRESIGGYVEFFKILWIPRFQHQLNRTLFFVLFRSGMIK
jgi:GR25 family glycosyltransferase involved in LPS biosynthesis